MMPSSARRLGFSKVCAHPRQHGLLAHSAPPLRNGGFDGPSAVAPGKPGLALRHQLLVLHRTAKRPRLTPLDRALWVWLPRHRRRWKTHLRIVVPDPQPTGLDRPCPFALGWSFCQGQGSRLATCSARQKASFVRSRLDQSAFRWASTRLCTDSSTPPTCSTPSRIRSHSI